MRLSILIYGFLLGLTTVYAQKPTTKSVSTHWQKIYRLSDTLLLTKANPSGTDLYTVAIANGHLHRMAMVAPVMDGQHTSDLRWDVDIQYMVGTTHYGFTPDEMHFIRKKEWNDTLAYAKLKKDIQETPIDVFRCQRILEKQQWYDRHILSRQFTGHRVLADKEYNRSTQASKKNIQNSYPIYSDFFMDKNRVLHMPYVYHDSVFFYQFSQKYWRQLTYKGTLTKATEDYHDPLTGQKDRWTAVDSLACPFNDNFRVVQLDSSIYFITEWSTKNSCQIFQYQNRTFKPIGRITRNTLPNKPVSHPDPSHTDIATLLLIDKDSQKLYLMPQLTLQLDPSVIQAGKVVPIEVLKSTDRVYTYLAAIHPIKYIPTYIKL